jgi:hypothetical protein
MSVVIIQPQAMKDRDAAGFFDDFHWFISPHLWTNLAADAGVTGFAAADTAGGNISGATGATDNNEIAVASTKKPFLLADDKPAFFEARVQYAEAATSAANVAVGFGDTIGSADFLVDNGAGCRSSWSGAVIYKVDGGTVWRCKSSNGTTSTDNVTAITAGGSAAQKLRIEVSDYTSLSCQVTYWVDDKQLRDATTNLPIVHTVLYASAAQMQAGAYLKAGSGTSETLVIDYMAAFQTR